LQNKESVYEIEWAPGFTYADVRFEDERQNSVYNFEMADIPTLWKLFDTHEGEAARRSRLARMRRASRFPVLPMTTCKCSNLFNLDPAAPSASPSGSG
jgi:glycyl-tRNA synthetase alpha chain